MLEMEVMKLKAPCCISIWKQQKLHSWDALKITANMLVVVFDVTKTILRLASTLLDEIKTEQAKARWRCPQRSLSEMPNSHS